MLLGCWLAQSLLSLFSKSNVAFSTDPRQGECLVTIMGHLLNMKVY